MASRSRDPQISSSELSDDPLPQDSMHDSPSRALRPTVIPRFPSFSKRHASFDSPREVPLPSPSLRQETVSPFSLAWDPMETPSPFFSSSRLNETDSVAPPSRPSSPPMAATVPLPKSPTLWSDSSSLPEPSKVAFHMFPRAGPHPKGKATPMPENEEGSTEKPLSSVQPGTERSPSPGSSSSSGSSSWLRSDVAPLLLDTSTSSSSGSSASIESMTSESSADLSRNNTPKSSDQFNKSSDFHGHSFSSTFSSYSSNGLGSAYARPERPPSPNPYLSRHLSISSRLGRPPLAHSASGYYIQPPEPPMILPPEPSDNLHQSGSALENDFNQRSAPHVPFLSRGPPPADSYIEVDTTLREYRLLVKLPGFTRDSITLASKRRRILHIVADRWDGVGGHFERRISFGYDADLVQVRAEFDGEMLRVIVPRRPMSLAGSN